MSPVCSQPSASIASAVCSGILEVLAHHVVAPHDDLAGLAARHLVAVVVDHEHLDAGDRSARRGADRLGGVVVAAHRRDAARLGEPVAGDDGLEAELLLHPLDQLDRHRRRAGDREAQRLQLREVDVGVVEERLVHRRRARGAS